MYLLNHTLKYLSIFLPLIIGVWAVIFYINMLDEVYDSIDDGLDNYKGLIIDKALNDSTVFFKKDFNESNYSINEVSALEAVSSKDIYTDTLMYMQNEEDFEPVRMLTTFFKDQEGRYYELKVISSMVEEDDLIEDLFFALVWLYLVLLASVLLVNNLVLKRVWKPFYLLVDQLSKFRLDQKKKVEPVGSDVKEFQMLSGAVKTLIERNVEIFNSQKQFIENAAHELQIPLAVSINKLELLAETASLSEQNLEQVASTIQTLERLTRLNRSLLLLSKIENKQFQEIEDVNFNKLIEKVRREFSGQAEHRDIAISVEEKGDLIRPMNNGLAEILVTNLFKNALTHNNSGGRVKVTITPSTLTIENTGPNNPLDSEKVFSRFYKQSNKKSSTGLGLAIVKAVVDLYGYSLSYYYSKEHVFLVRF